jgi:hypothetical protein
MEKPSRFGRSLLGLFSALGASGLVRRIALVSFETGWTACVVTF